MNEPLWSVERKDCTVWVFIHTNLDTCKPIKGFGHKFENQEAAELMCQHLEKTFRDWNEYVAAHPDHFIWDENLSKVKKYLNERWNAKTHEWK